MTGRDELTMEQGAEIYRLKNALVDVANAATLQEAQEIVRRGLAEPPRGAQA